MQYCALPSTNIKMSVFSLGTMMFGGQTSEGESLAMIQYAYEQGVNCLDTANSYTGGRSEEIVGKALKGIRGEVILSTKVHNAVTGDINSGGLSRRSIIANLEASLKRLDTDYIDIYYLHSPDPHTSLGETMEAMHTLVKAGKIRYIGLSNFAAWQLADVLAVCDKQHYIAPVIAQNVLNLLTRGLEAELVPCIQKHRIGLTVYNPIAAGLLTGKHKFAQLTANTRFSNDKEYYARYWNERNFNAVSELAGIGAASGESLLSLAIKWCVSRPYVTSVVFGGSRLSQLKENIRIVDGGALGEDTLKKCDAVWEALAGKQFPYFR